MAAADQAPAARDAPKPLWRRVLSTQAVTAGAGILIMVLTLFCNNWVIKAQTVFANLERVNSAFDSFDHTDLVLMYDLCDRHTEDMSPADLARFVRVGNSVQQHEALLQEARDTAMQLINSMELPKINFGASELEALGPIDTTRMIAPDIGGADAPAGDLQANTGAVPAAMTGGADPAKGAAGKTEMVFGSGDREKEIICSKLANDPSDLVQNFRAWRTSLRRVSSELQILGGDLMFTGLGPGSNEILEQKLRAKMTIVTHWWLPVLNGALGAVIYCLTKMLKDRATAPKMGEVVLRMVFGGFAGILVSTLLLPSGVVVGPYVASAPGVSLLAFIFGFSLDSFIALLERLNRLVVESTRPKSSGG
ncbi:hypothetical protein ACFMPD_08005 [Sedimentitalea sp. HM32M-2]|uniref:hypothetical protein n=1 Tax=Sedimentitalea sp. HM32M-2 TaxID=3351566 RepID=UPI0036383DD3